MTTKSKTEQPANFAGRFSLHSSLVIRQLSSKHASDQARANPKCVVRIARQFMLKHVIFKQRSTHKENAKHRQRNERNPGTKRKPAREDAEHRGGITRMPHETIRARFHHTMSTITLHANHR